MNNPLETAYAEYFGFAYTYAEEQFNLVVLPYLRKHHETFASGMGAWWIYHPGKENLRADNWIPANREGRKVLEVLTMEVPGYPAGDLGSLMPDYKGEG